LLLVFVVVVNPKKFTYYNCFGFLSHMLCVCFLRKAVSEIRGGKSFAYQTEEPQIFLLCGLLQAQALCEMNIISLLRDFFSFPM
jgi:hypothetical protein